MAQEIGLNKFIVDRKMAESKTSYKSFDSWISDGWQSENKDC